MKSAVDEVRPVVVGDQTDPGGQILTVDVIDLGPDQSEDVQGILALAKQNDALDDVVAFVLAHETKTHGRTHGDGSEVPDEDRGAAPDLHRDASDVALVAHEAEATHDVHLRPVLDVGAARVLVAVGESLEHVVEGNAKGFEPHRIDEDLVLLGRPAEAADVDDAGDLAQLSLDHPVLEGLQFRG